jgi:hypothetical protein
MILKDSWEEVIYLSSNIQDIPHPVRKSRENMCSAIQDEYNPNTVSAISNIQIPFLVYV